MNAPRPGSLRAEHKRTSPLAGANWPSGVEETAPSWGSHLVTGVVLALCVGMFVVGVLGWFAPEGCPVEDVVFHPQACAAYERGEAYWDARMGIDNNPHAEVAP